MNMTTCPHCSMTLFGGRHNSQQAEADCIRLRHRRSPATMAGEIESLKHEVGELRRELAELRRQVAAKT